MALHRAIATVGAIAAALVGSGCSDEIAPPPPPPATADIAAGGQHTCRLTGAGTTAPAFCWGDNSFGQLGDGSTTSSATPVPVSGGLSFTQLTTGSGHTCGLTAVGAAYCWGRNAEGQLGIGSTANSSVPVSVAGGLTLTALAAGSLHTCGLTEVRHRLLGHLSKGFRQRVGLAQALIHDPPVLILDEPTIGLDPRQIIEIRSLIKTLRVQRTVVLSTHILPEVSQVCDKVVVVNEGRVVLEDQLANLTRTRTLEEVFIEAISRDTSDGARAAAAAEEQP